MAKQTCRCDPGPRACKFCRQVFELRPKSDVHRVTCYDCGDYFNTIEGQVWLRRFQQKQGAKLAKQRLDAGKDSPDFTPVAELRREWYATQEGKCAHCKELYEAKGLVLDHKTPIDVGGKTTCSNTWLICRSCRRIKDRILGPGASIKKLARDNAWQSSPDRVVYFLQKFNEAVSEWVLVGRVDTKESPPGWMQELLDGYHGLHEDLHLRIKSYKQ